MCANYNCVSDFQDYEPINRKERLLQWCIGCRGMYMFKSFQRRIEGMDS